MAAWPLLLLLALALAPLAAGQALTGTPAPDAEEETVQGCETDDDCVYGGLCRKKSAEATSGTCVCFRSCSRGVPVECAKSLHCVSPNNTCNKEVRMCVCPPTRFERCAKRDLSILQLSATKDTPYRGERTELACCINSDPRGHVHDVHFLHNATLKRAPTETPFDRGLGSKDKNAWYERCWYLNLTAVSQRDSGSWRCVVPSTVFDEPITKEINIVVRDGFQIFAKITQSGVDESAEEPSGPEAKPSDGEKPIRVEVQAAAASPTALRISWDTGPVHLAVNLVVETSSRDEPAHDLESFTWKGLTNSSMVVEGLTPATWYTATIATFKVKDNATFLNKAYARTLPDLSEPVELVEIRIKDRLVRRKCEISWRPPEEDNGKIDHYEVVLEGRVREALGALSTPHRPSAVCGSARTGSNGRLWVPPAAFMICEFQGLLPNRNYQAKVWVVNEAGTSEAATFDGQCRTDFAGPDSVPIPHAAESANNSIRLNFPLVAEETNGPISCYYVALMPLPDGVPEALLAPPQEVPIDSLQGVLESNLDSVASDGGESPMSHQQLAYIAESYKLLPANTSLGDGLDRRECPVLFRSRYKAEDRPLRVGVRYTGFLIVRVDPDPSLYDEAREQDDGKGRYRRQLSSWLQPRYSYSKYFPSIRVGVSGRARADGGWVGVTVGLSLLLLVLLIAGLGLALYFWRSDGKQIVAERLSRLLSAPLRRANGSHATPATPGTTAKDSPGLATTANGHFYGPVPAGSLVAEYQERRRDSDLGFQREFEALPHHGLPSTASTAPDNARKNRYNDIKAFDSTRVVLRQLSANPASDYINANYVEGWRGKRRFIAAQGPLPETVPDFWRMVWEQQVQIIVMVTKLQEKYRSQCTQYWPEGEAMLYGDVEVRPKEVAQSADFVMRSFDLVGPAIRPVSLASEGQDEPLYDSVPERSEPGNRSIRSGESNFQRSDSGRSGLFERAGSGRSDRSSSHSRRPGSRRSRHSSVSSPSNSARLVADGASSPLLGIRETAPLPTQRTLVQWHYTGWHDFKAPECTVSLLRFLHRLRAQPLFSAPFPIVVHCSAGVGRTGTFIAIDGLLSQLEEEGKADVFGLVSQLRASRNFMVQSLEQYVFVYKALAEWRLFGDTDAPAEKLPKLAAKKKESGAMRIEYTKLSQTLEAPPPAEWGRKEQNRAKNRNGAVLPFDRNRICLQPVLGHQDASYVNASVVKGVEGGLLLTQDPLPDSRWDFWRLVNEQSIGSILCLSSGQPGAGEEPLEAYWPSGTGQELRLGEASPKVGVWLLKEEKISPHLLRRRLAYAVAKDPATAPRKEAVQWVLLDWWPGGSATPSSPGPLLDLLCQLRERSPDALPSPGLLLHCRDGSARCGLVAALVLLLQRLRTEQRLDIFQTAKAVQAARMATLPDFPQYQFLYDAVRDYLESNPPD